MESFTFDQCHPTRKAGRCLEFDPGWLFSHIQTVPWTLDEQACANTLSFLCRPLSANAPAFSWTFKSSQVHFHRHLHFRIVSKNIGERILYDGIHLSSRSMELAGLLCDCHGVSTFFFFVTFLFEKFEVLFSSPFPKLSSVCMPMVSLR